MKVIIIFSLIVSIAFTPLTLKAQDYEANENAEELFVINGSSATVYEWFKILEDKGISLAYNASQIDLKRRVTLADQKGSIKEILELILYNYEFNLHHSSGNKVLIQIKGNKKIQFYGKIQDKDSGETLYGYVVTLKDSRGKPHYSLANSNGFFSFKLPVDTYTLTISYIGYYTYQEEITLFSDLFTTIRMKQQSLSIDEVTVTPSPFNKVSDSQNPVNL